MTGAGDGTDSSARPERQWDVALSFAGAQRGYVGQVAEALKARGVRCFYDADEQIDLWGKYLADELPAIYGEQAAAVVMFVSAEYTAREWTRLERRTVLARAVRERREYVLPARFDETPLPGLPSDMVMVDLRTRTPRQFATMIANKLATLAASAALADAAGRARSARPAGTVRVSEADPRRLGVHAAISVPGVPDEVLPEYVPRDTDTDEHGVRANVTAAAQRGGFVLLLGGSSVGKTRCAAEAVKELLPDWWLIHPPGPAEVETLAASPPARTVVWLDELQRYLDGEHSLAAGTIRALLNAPGLVVIIATLWPDRYTAYTAVPVSGGSDPHAREREVLELATIIRIRPQFSGSEQERARDGATRDPRLAAAVKADEYGLTQTLAAAPQLVSRWEDAQETNPYAWAVLTAALDAARLGARAPLTAGLLRAAAPGYCTSAQLAEAPGNWFGQALAYATEKLHGAAAALSPAGADIGQIDGYTAADYLIQHASRERRYARVPASTWDALITHVRDPADAARLAGSARDRLLYRYAIPLYRRAADAGYQYAARELARLLARRGDLDELRARADAGDQQAAQQLAELLARRGDLRGLRARADAGDHHAARELARLLADRGDLKRAVRVLRAPADAGDEHATRELARLLVRRGDLRGLRARADAGDRNACIGLAELLARRGDLRGLRARADTDRNVARQLAELLADRGDLDELRARADAGDEHATEELARLLAFRSDLDELRARADADDKYATWHVARLLADRDDLDGAVRVLRARADAGDRDAAKWLVDLLTRHGDLDQLRAQARAGDEYATRQLAQLLADRGDLDELTQVLRAGADAGDWQAAKWLVDLLARRGDLDELRARADAGNKYATWQFPVLLADRGDLDELRARADAGDETAARELARLLARRGDLDELRARADAGNKYATWELPVLLDEQGRPEEAKQLYRFGLNLDGSIASA